MAPETSPPGGATRYIQTSRGLLSYSQLAPLLAEQVLRVERDIAAGAYAQRSEFPELILHFHCEIAGELCPDWAGQWRNAEVRVGEHHPPPPYRVPMLMRDYGEDLRVRLANASGRMDDLLLETLAFAEGRLLSIHPFTDFNGRVTRLFLRELLRRLELPPVDLVPTSPSGETAYRAALRSGDALDWRPLMRIWQQRFEQFTDATE
jgi:CRISPR-associated endonuclease/helicase Cas3